MVLVAGDQLVDLLQADLQAHRDVLLVAELQADSRDFVDDQLLFRTVVEILHDARQLDFMVALGTHPAMSPLDVVSHVHGQYIYQVGYHILPYFLNDWERFSHIPLGVLAHSTHVRGSGIMDGGVEKPNVRVTLASRVSPEDCARLNLGYLDPAVIDIADWQGREDEGILYVPRAGEVLYRTRS
jgi:hypothetical protein